MATLEEQGRALLGAVEALSTRCTNSLDSADAAQLRRLLAMVRPAQRRLDSLVVRVAVRCNDLADEGHAAPAAEELLGEGQVRGITARRESARADLIARLPAAVPWDGLGPDHLDSLARRTRSLAEDELARLDTASLVADGAALPADTFDATVKRAVDAAVGAIEDKRAASEFRHWFDRSKGLGRFVGALDPERYEALVTAIERRTAALASAGELDGGLSSGLAAEALVDLVVTAEGRGARLPHVTVVVDESTLRYGAHRHSILETGDGRELGPEAVARLCCDAVLRQVLLDERGVPIRVGRRYRTATDAQWAAIRAVHAGCAWSNCEQPLSHCQAHHITPWNRGGSTDLDNLVPLCARHHHRVHEGRWRIRLRSDRSLAIHRPDGEFHADAGPPTRRPPPTRWHHRTAEPAGVRR